MEALNVTQCTFGSNNIQVYRLWACVQDTRASNLTYKFVDNLDESLYFLKLQDVNKAYLKAKYGLMYIFLILSRE